MTILTGKGKRLHKQRTCVANDQTNSKSAVTRQIFVNAEKRNMNMDDVGHLQTDWGSGFKNTSVAWRHSTHVVI